MYIILRNVWTAQLWSSVPGLVYLFYCHILKILDEEKLLYERGEKKKERKYKMIFLWLYLFGKNAITEEQIVEKVASR